MELVDPELLEILVCPETKQRITLAEQPLIDKLNAEQKAGALKNRGGEPIHEPIDGGLIREDRQYLYPIISGIPVMLAEAAIPLKEHLG